jgi:ABC-type nitrate/sulfonate/bicarbonate transport system substrate-binding protein
MIMVRLDKLIIGSIILLFLWIFYGGQIAYAQDRLALRVGYLAILTQLPLVVSYENDRLSFDKVDLEIVRYNSFTSLEAAFRVGAIDVAALPVPIVFSVAGDGHKVNIIGSFHGGGSRLVARAQGNLETVRGKLIGVPGLDSNENLRLSQVLGEVNLRQGLDYKTIEVPFNTAVSDLKAAKLDAIYLPEPLGTIAENDKIAVALDGQSDKLTGTLNTVLAINSEILERNRVAVQEWLLSVLKGCRFIEEDIDKTGARQTAIIQRTYFNFPDDIVTAALGQRKGGLQFDQFVPQYEKLREYLKLATQMKLLKKSVDLNSLINLELIQQIS